MQASALNHNTGYFSPAELLFGRREKRRFRLSQDGEIVSNGNSRYFFVGFCDDGDYSSVIGSPAHLGRKLGFVRDFDSYTVRQLVSESGSYILLSGSFSSEIFRLAV